LLVCKLRRFQKPKYGLMEERKRKRPEGRVCILEGGTVVKELLHSPPSLIANYNQGAYLVLR